MKALLVIDMQQGSFTKATPRFDAEGVVARINKLAATFRSNGDAVVFIQHDGSAQGDFIPFTTEWDLLPGLQVVKDTDTSLGKTANDCFYRSDLGSFLEKQDIQDLVVTGCATDFCVDATIKAALGKDYHITVIADGHTTADRPGLAAVQVIAHYNWIWQNMLPTQGSLQVCPAAYYLEQF